MEYLDDMFYSHEQFLRSVMFCQNKEYIAFKIYACLEINYKTQSNLRPNPNSFVEHKFQIRHRFGLVHSNIFFAFRYVDNIY